MESGDTTYVVQSFLYNRYLLLRIVISRLLLSARYYQGDICWLTRALTSSVRKDFIIPEVNIEVFIRLLSSNLISALEEIKRWILVKITACYSRKKHLVYVRLKRLILKEIWRGNLVICSNYVAIRKDEESPWINVSVKLSCLRRHQLTIYPFLSITPNVTYESYTTCEVGVNKAQTLLHSLNSQLKLRVGSKPKERWEKWDIITTRERNISTVASLATSYRLAYRLHWFS